VGDAARFFFGPTDGEVRAIGAIAEILTAPVLAEKKNG
jgi:hypothetical protein